jgi:hypothetical protein
MPDNLSPSAAGFTHSGDEAPLVNEKNNLDKTKHRSEHDSKMKGQRRKRKGGHPS